MTALNGIRVIDLTRYISGPFCTRQLATMGAEIIKIEKPISGDPTRNIEPFYNDEPGIENSGLFLYLNMSKKGITLDYKKPKGKEILLELVKTADIVVENFRPTFLPELNLSYEDLKKVNPNLIMTSISNFGQTGPYRDFELTEIVMYAMGLTMNVTGLANREPQKAGLTVMQHQAGSVAANATLGAYLGREMHGISQHIDVSLLETQLTSIDRTGAQLLGYQFSGSNPFQRFGETSISILPMGVYPVSDGYVMFVGAHPHWWPRFVKMIDRPDLFEDPRFQDSDYNFVYNLDYKEELEAIILEWMVQRSKQEVMQEAQAAGMAGTAINSMADAIVDPQFNFRNFFVEIDHPTTGTIKYPGVPAHFTDIIPELNRAPLLGEHNKEIYGKLGYDEAELEKLVLEEVI